MYCPSDVGMAKTGGDPLIKLNKLLFSYFPTPMVQFMYAVLTTPMIFVSLVNDPLYKLILSGQTSAEHFDFKKSIFRFSQKK